MKQNIILWVFSCFISINTISSYTKDITINKEQNELKGGQYNSVTIQDRTQDLTIDNTKINFLENFSSNGKIIITNSFINDIFANGTQSSAELVFKDRVQVGEITNINTKKISINENSNIQRINNNGILEQLVFGDYSHGSNDGIHNHYVATLEKLTNKSYISDILIQHGVIKNITNEYFIGKIEIGKITDYGYIDSILNDDRIGNIEIIGKNSLINNLKNNGHISRINILNGAFNKIENSGQIIGITNEKYIHSIVNNNYISLIKNDNRHNTNTPIIKTITNDNLVKTITNKGLIENIENKKLIQTITNDGLVKNIKNEGEISNLINNQKIDTITNNANGKITIINNGDIDNITNNGEIHIKNNLNVNMYTKTPLTINNNNKITIDGYYFDKPEFMTDEEQKQNSIKINGNANLVSITNVTINDKNVVKGKIYHSNTFFQLQNDQNVNDGKGINGNDIIGITGIFQYEGTGNLGEYKVKGIEKKELSGESLFKSLINSSRLKYINVSNILDEVTSKKFRSEDLTTHGGHQTDNYSFVLPYHTKTTLDIDNSLKLKGSTNGFVAGSQRQLPKNRGVITFYLGHEDSNFQRNDQKLNLKNHTYHSGLSYYKTLKRDEILNYYLKANVNFDYTQSNIEKFYSATVEKTNAKAKSFGYDADILFGANYYMQNHDLKLNPEFGLSYKGINFNNFTITHIGGLKEHYLSQHTNFIDSVAALKFQALLNGMIKTNLRFGVLYNIHSNAKEEFRLGNNYLIGSELKFPKWYTFTQAGLSFPINDNMNISLNYNGIFTFKETQAHTAFLRMSLWW